jgi:hypothetical protein
VRLEVESMETWWGRVKKNLCIEVRFDQYKKSANHTHIHHSTNTWCGEIAVFYLNVTDALWFRCS